jgi:glycosyltransferase involved in cell wall biosynthesis
MPSERPATGARGSEVLSVALDATPLLGRPTGVGAFCGGALAGLAARPDVSASAFAVSWRRRHLLADLVPAGVGVRQRAMPARPLLRAWRRGTVPPVDWFIGRHDVVHGTNFVVPPTAHGARVATVHDLTVVRFPELCDGPTLAYPDLIRRSLADGAWIHTPSVYVAGEVVEAFGADPDRVRAVHHGVPALPPPDLGADGTAVLPFVLPAGTRRYVLALGTIEPRKDYPSLVAAFTALAREDPDLALVIVGADGWGSDAVSRAIAASPAAGRILRPGYLSGRDVATALAGAAVLAFPSVYEGFGLPPVQAMAAGTPVVTTAVGAIPEVVGDAAVLIAPGDPDALAGALAGVLAGGDEVVRLVARGRDRAIRFTWDACASGLAGLYRDAAADSRTAPARGSAG